MTARRGQIGSTTALVALAVAVSLGSATDLQAGVALAQYRPESRAASVERKAVVQFLSCLGEAVRSMGLDRPAVGQVAILPAAGSDPDLHPEAGLAHAAHPAFRLPHSIPACHLIDLPPPATMH